MDPAGGKGNDWRPWFRRLLTTTVAILACGAVLLLGEVAARILRPEWQPGSEERVKFWRYDERLGWAHRPGQHGLFRHIDFCVRVDINSAGLRDTEYPRERNDKRRMLVLGDSFGWGYGVEHDERFSEILEAAHPDWEIVNASVSGYGTDQEYLYLRDQGLSYHPDVVLLLFTRGDLDDNSKSRQHWYNKPQFVVGDSGLELRNVPVPAATLRQVVGRFALGRTYLGRGLYGLLEHRVSLLSGWSPRPTGGGGSSGAHDPYSVTRRLIAAVDELAASHGARLVVVSVPMGGLERKVLEDTCASCEIPYLALDAAFEDVRTATRFQHNQHWNAEGHAIAARAIDEFLRSLGVFSAEQAGAPDS